MKALVIPDVHLKPYMFKEAAEWMRKGVADRAVCLMDIPDDWNREYDIELYAQTFDAAISFAKEFPDTLWCYGNHDLCYLWNERESGYSRAAAYTVRNKLEELKEALPAGNQIRYIQRIDDVLLPWRHLTGICRGKCEKYRLCGPNHRRDKYHGTGAAMVQCQPHLVPPAVSSGDNV